MAAKRLQALQPEGVARPKAPYSPVVVDGDLVLTAGQIALDGTGTLVAGGIEEQTRQALENVRACLRAAGCELGDVLKVTAFLADLGDFPAYNDVYREFFEEPFPARTTVGASLPEGILVEIEAIARRGS
jgi:2-iminobutanoate/2-iminopropanoate deaminase